MLDDILDFMEEHSKTIAIIIITALVTFGVTYAISPVFKMTISGQAQIVYTGNIEFKGLYLQDTTLNITVNVITAKTYNFTVSIATNTYSNLYTLSLGIQTVTFTDLSLPSAPFTIYIQATE